MFTHFPLQTQETREILHFHYTTWPDFGVPESPASFLNFLFKVRESGCLNSDQGPVVVHCSAGIGRSGTFCLVDTCLLLVCTELCYWEIMTLTDFIFCTISIDFVQEIGWRLTQQLSYNYIEKQKCDYSIKNVMYWMFLLLYVDVHAQGPVFSAYSWCAAGDATLSNGLDSDSRSTSLLLPCCHWRCQVHQGRHIFAGKSSLFILRFVLRHKFHWVYILSD